MNAVHRVLLTDSISPAGEEVLARRAEIIRAPDADPVTLRRLARDAEGIITRSKLPDDIIAVAPRLRPWSCTAPAPIWCRSPTPPRGA